MREIKFRAWNIKDKVMCYSNEDDDRSYWDGVYKSTVELINERLNDKYNKYKWMQYTGLKDKNGVEIYEGDIVKVSIFEQRNKSIDIFYNWNFINGYLHEIIIDGGAAKLKPHPHNSVDYPFLLDSWMLNIEVIGNIYEHGNLLNEN